MSKRLLHGLLVAAGLGWPACAAPLLTTIQDVLYKADGTRFNGTVTISWSSFEAPDLAAIATQMMTVKVQEGNLRVQLVPNLTSNPQGFYSVVYNSDGRVQFTENWAVPPSTQPLRIRDVRIAAPASGVANDTTGVPTQESDIAGLIADLSARPLKGPAFAAGRVAMVNPLGALDSVMGNPADCVRVDGSSGPCGGAAASFVDGDIPSGIVDGANATFALSGTPSPGSSLAVYRNGLLQAAGADFSLSNNVIQFAAAGIPQPGDTLLAAYRISGADSGQLFSPAQVLCSGTGATINVTVYSSLASCSVPANTLKSGDRVEIRFDAAHQGNSSGFAFEIRWGATTMLHRDGTPPDAQITGRADAGLDSGGAQLSTQSWGTSLPFAATVGSATDAYGSGLTISFQGKMNNAGETLTLRNYAVVRLP